MDSFDNGSRDEDNILEKNIYRANMFRMLLWGIKILSVIEEMYILRITALYKKELIKLGFRDNSMLVCIFVLCYETQKSS